MSDLDRRDTPEQYRLAGEDTPAWPAMAFALIETLLADAATWLWMTGQPRLQEPLVRSDSIQEQAAVTTTQPAASPPMEPISSPAETPEVAVVEKEQWALLSEPSPAPRGVPATMLASPSDAREKSADEQTEPASTQLLPERKDCPPAITILFKRNRVNPVMTDSVRGRLEKLRAWLDGHPEVKLAVEGHADSRGSERYNLLLSHRRAKAMAALLTKAGVPEARMTLFAVGENDPLAGKSADSEDNRRVFLHVKGIESCWEASTDRER